jgi:hypothetical protein
MSVLLEPVKAYAGGYHEAFLYSGTAEFLAGTMSFISRAVDAGDPILVILTGPKIDLLRRRLGTAAGNVSFADMSDVGGNPAGPDKRVRLVRDPARLPGADVAERLTEQISIRVAPVNRVIMV